MNTHILNISKEPFVDIAVGKKIIESRLYTDERKKFAVGDTVVFELDGTTQKMTAQIDALYKHPSFDTLFSSHPVINFGKDSKKALMKQIRQFYSKEDEERFGVVGIRFTLL